MTTIVTLPTDIGGDGETYSDGNDPATGMGNGGYLSRFMPLIAAIVGVANYIKVQAASLLSNAGSQATSATSATIGTGAQTFALAQTGKAFALGQWVLIADSAAPATNWMIGQVTAFVDPSLTVQVTATAGAGTKTAWTISATAAQGVIGSDLTASKRVIFNGAISPAALGVSQNDWAPAGVGAASTIKVSASAAGVHLTGLSAGVDGQEITLENTGATNPILLDSQSVSSAAANRFALPGGLAKRLNPGESVVLVYEGTAGRWMLAAGLASAQAADIRAGSAYAGPLTPQDFYDAAAEVTLTDAATIVVDFSTFLNGVVTLGGNRTLGNPTNVKAGMRRRLRVVQDGAGGRTLAFGANYKRPGGAPALTGTAGANDIIDLTAISPTFILYTIQKNPS